MHRKTLKPEEALAAAQRWLARREYSQSELRQRLRQAGVPATEATDAVAELAEAGWQSDERFALSLVRTRAAQGKGPQLVRAEFDSHDLPAAYWDAAVEQEEVDWAAAAVTALRRTSHRDENKRWQFLSRRGFTAAQIRAVLRGDEEL